jgi:putative solute:sodium symporter small subunit
MNGNLDINRLLAKKKQLKMLMAMMLVFTVIGPLVGPKLFADEFSHLNGDGLRFFYIATPTAFVLLFFFYLAMYRRADRKLKELQ